MPCIAVNDAYLFAPWANALLFGDIRWWEWHRKGVARPGRTAEEVRQRFEAFPGYRIKVEQPGTPQALLDDERYYLLQNWTMYSDGILSERPDSVCAGMASGYAAMNVAYLAGAARILLLGFDGETGDKAPHWFGDHPETTHPGWLKALPWQFQRIGVALEKRGVQVINCSKDSAFKDFTNMPLREALALP